MSSSFNNMSVAIVGMAGRFPGADNIDEFWENVLSEVACIQEYDIEDIVASGVDKSLAAGNRYVKRGATLKNIDLFDARFFDYLPSEAELIDPQIRIFLETVQEALDNAGCDPERFEGDIGVYGGAGLNNYFLKNIMRSPGVFEDLLDFQKIISNDKDLSLNSGKLQI